jgi:hypothetical protein
MRPACCWQWTATSAWSAQRAPADPSARDRGLQTGVSLWTIPRGIELFRRKRPADIAKRLVIAGSHEALCPGDAAHQAVRGLA